jgi:2-keto-4-pentenoate hydratase/2-oxohepta-3-ene-1,7-dioic acid hydratase in catechol pathway
MAKLLTFAPDPHSTQRLGAAVGDQVLDLPRAYRRVFQGTPPDWFRSVGELLNGGSPALAIVRELLERVGADREPAELHSVDGIVFGLPTGTSPKVLCVTMNYASHAKASGLTKQSEEPYFFIKLPQLLTPHRAPVLCSKTSKKCDSEIELAVVIGKRGKYIAPEQAMDHVAGYTVANDFSFRDRRTLKSDPNTARLNWLTLKNLDTAAPIGPWLVTKDDIADPYALDITLTLDNDGQERQTGNTSGMMHTIEELIHHASDGLTLEPGDVILTGTPHEVAFGHERFLREGDILRAEIQQIGALVTPVSCEA